MPSLHPRLTTLLYTIIILTGTAISILLFVALELFPLLLKRRVRRGTSCNKIYEAHSVLQPHQHHVLTIRGLQSPGNGLDYSCEMSTMSLV